REAGLMHPLRVLDTLRVFCALLCASSVLVVSNGSACRWHAELFDYTTKETTHFRIDETPLTLPLVREEQGLHVTCGLQQSALLAIGTVQSHKVDITTWRVIAYEGEIEEDREKRPGLSRVTSVSS